MFRKFISMMLSLVLIVGLAVPAFAAENETTTSVDGMDRFMELTASGTIFLDIEGALSAGYTEQCVAAVAAHIDSMNQLVINGNAYIDDTFTATVYFVSPRAKGESKVVTHWYGLTQMYLNSDETEDLIDNLESAGTVFDLVSLVGWLPGSVAGAIGGLSDIFGYGTTFYLWQVENAAQAGNGIIMNIQTDFVYGSQTIWFTSQ